MTEIITRRSRQSRRRLKEVTAMTVKRFARSRRELDEITKELRRSGYNIVTYGKELRELERGEEIIVIEVRRR